MKILKNISINTKKPIDTVISVFLKYHEKTVDYQQALILTHGEYVKEKIGRDLFDI